MMVNYISCTGLLRYSAACVQRAARINREMKTGDENGLLSFFFAYRCTIVACLPAELGEAGPRLIA